MCRWQSLSVYSSIHETLKRRAKAFKNHAALGNQLEMFGMASMSWRPSFCGGEIVSDGCYDN